ncbi:MAG TPA: dienelactone hydrolase family protein [Allosphingosinicella sp.]|nr:dienelactone hydrolase family protein [Allosphingosinicella sp.]
MKRDVERQAIDLYDRFTHEGMDRRVFMAKLTRIAGSAAAASALLADVACKAESQPQVAVDDSRVNGTELTWEPRPGRHYRGYRVIPTMQDRRGLLPVVMVIHENRGLNDHIRDVARRFALAGFEAVAPDWLSPAGGTPAGDDDRARTMIGQLDMAETVADGVATIGWLGTGRGTERKVGIVGFCWGGALVDRLAVASGETLSAAVSYYGPAPAPVEAARVRAPMLIHLAGLDNRVNGTAKPFAAALQAAGRQVTLVEHPNVDHAFNNDTSAARYNREAATRAWEQTLAFFRQHLR